MGYSVQFLACIKVIVVILNILLLLIGLTMIGIGIWLRVDPKMYEPTNYIGTQSFIIAAWILMFTGLFVVIISFFGCFGAANDSAGMLCIYFAVMSILVALEIACVVLSSAHGFDETLEKYVTEQVLLNVQQRYFNDNAKEFLDFVQVKLVCCGAESFNDYYRYGQDVPISCGAVRSNYINREGCGRVMRKFYELRAGIVIGLCVLAAIFQLGSIIGAISVYCAIKHTEEVND
ncbi:CD9 antigen-like protein [Dinothrombium tinctorium]|uniref:Tetraspanin n=1 Tax=Dinothrombium tinctorium TaxID=1965070 RepID=A0A3S3NPG7_9ACAR|nr:CD9 antigen-like protein [Dinothrombium tinctorium]